MLARDLYHTLRTIVGVDPPHICTRQHNDAPKSFIPMLIKVLQQLFTQDFSNLMREVNLSYIEMEVEIPRHMHVLGLEF